MRGRAPLSAASCDLAVRVTPRSSQNKIEWVGGIYKVWVTASPTDGQANEAVCQIVAKALKQAPSTVSVKRGQTGRDKVLSILGLSLEEVQARLK